MICPNCSVAFFEEWFLVGHGPVTWTGKNGTGIQYTVCPVCKLPIIRLIYGDIVEDEEDFEYDEKDENIPLIRDSKLIYPSLNEQGLSEEIPEKYKVEFAEALSLVKQSPKASAALSRRLLQKLLIEEARVKTGSLSEQINEFCTKRVFHKS